MTRDRQALSTARLRRATADTCFFSQNSDFRYASREIGKIVGIYGIDGP